jgi:hypothetical protein
VYSPPTNLKEQTNGVTPPPQTEDDMVGILDGEGDADGENNDGVDADQSTENDNKSKKQKKVCQKSPIKSRWLIPIVKAEVSQRLNIPNKELKALLKDYVKDIFLTPSLLQQTRTAIRKEYLVIQTPMSCMSQPFRGCYRLLVMTLSSMLERRMICCANVRKSHSHSILP